MKSTKKKLLALILACSVSLSVFACDEESEVIVGDETSSSIEIELSEEISSSLFLDEESSYLNFEEEEFNWNKAGKGAGSYIPEPNFEYELKAWSSYLCVEVQNITEEDFYNYVELCLESGFDGEVDSAISPSLYLMAYNEENCYLEIFYYEDSQRFTIYITPPKSN